ncbi:DUF2188 domain-containing protein [Oleiharenicola lentus]|uniref:DUF2188 domain-containing protein n=1 Tax=Oleiharenicola lentus TaxID=2508720 RepID=UPI003F6718C8
MPTRKIYHVLPGENGWSVKVGAAKRASVVLPTKDEAVKAASDLAKSSPTAQVVIHEATGKIEGDRKYGLTDFKKKKKVRVAVSKGKKTKLKNRIKKYRVTTEHRKAALLGVARQKRAHSKRSAIAKKAAKKRLKKYVSGLR